MAFNTGWTSITANDFGSDFDWYDGGDFTSPSEGGYPGGIPGYDNYQVGDVTPSGGGGAITGVNPDTGAVKMDFTGMAPGVVDTSQPGSLDFGPGAVTMPSGGVYDILNTPTTPVDYTPNDWTPLTVGGQELSPADFAGAADTLTVNQGPSLLGDQIDTTGFGDYLSGGTVPGTGSNNVLGDLGPVVPTGGTTDLSPIVPTTTTTTDDNIPTLTITDNKPKVTLPTIDTTLIPYNPNDVIIPVTPEDTTPTITVVDKRPPPPPPEPPIIVEPPIVEPPIVEPPPPPPPPPEPPVVVPPLPPIVTPPPPPPEPPVPPVVVNPQTGEMINPGWIQATPFYNTTNAAQSKFFWGGHGPQFATGTGASPFNAQAYNQVAAPATPWGLGQVAAPLSPADMNAIIAGTYVAPKGTPAATRAQAYKPQTLVAPSYGQVKIGGPVAPTTTTATSSAKTKDLYTADQKTAISQALGSDWQSRLDKAALNGDYATIVDIQKQIDSVLNPVVDRY